MRSRNLSLPAAALLMVAGTIVARGEVGSTTKWTIDDLIKPQRASSWTLSPDGTLAAWVRSQYIKVDDEDKNVSHLWLTRLPGGESVQLTRGNDGASSPKFSPDGKLIAFTTSRAVPGAKKELKGKRQIWAIPVGGGEAYPITKLDRGARSYAWADNDSMIVLAEESPTLWAKQTKKKKDTAVVVDDAERKPPVRLFRITVKDGSAERLTDNTDWISSMSVSRAGKWAVVNVQQSLSFQFDAKVPPHTKLVDLQTGEMTRLFADTKLLPGRAQWEKDGSGFYFTNGFSNHPMYRSATITELHHYDMNTKVVEKVDIDWMQGLSRGFVPTDDGVIVFLAEGVRDRPVRMTRTDTGWTKTELTGAHTRGMGSLVTALDAHTIVYRYSSATVPTQFFAAKLDGTRIVDEKQLTKLNPSYKDKPTGRVEAITWRGANDALIEGMLHYPLDWTEGERSPLVINPHGGPASRSRDAWSLSWGSPRILWRQAGAFVLEPNYHGSTGYGLDFVEAIGGGNYCELEIPDLEKGVDHLIELGLVDADRLASAGWSNGGILTAELITRSTRWKAASVGAADVEWISDWANVDFGASFDNYYFGASPLEDPELYIRKSAFFRLPNVTTPTIIYTGTKDRNVPPHQSWSLFRALQQLEKAPTRLVLFPGEPHGLRKLAHQRRKLEEDVAWFDRYLFNTLEEENDAIKEKSNLGALMALAKVSRAGHLYGKRMNGALVPETVSYKKMTVGRFEVTQAQWAAFDTSYHVAAGRENHPVTGVTLDRIKSYIEWLSSKTGELYRLPTEKEAKKLAATGGGNTLDHWAGYAPNPDDVARLHEAIKELPGSAPLLREVGTFAGKGDPPVYDLNGNAAEWALGENGEGLVRGPSADRAGDKRDKRSEAGEAYRGFRVVVGPILEDTGVTQRD